MINKNCRQLTEEEAIAFANSKEWESWTSMEIFEFQVTQERLCLPNFSIFHECTETALERSVWTHEFTNPDCLIQEYLDRIADTYNKD